MWVTGFGGNVLAMRQVRRSDFAAANQWQNFTLQFDNPCFGTFEARVWWNGNTSMKFAQLTITPLNVASAGVQWLVTDQLGTPRMVFDQTGSLANISRHDYLPFGEELYAGVGGRTTQEGYVSDSVRQHFTGYENDLETGLNFAQARYQSPVQGRFTSPDTLPGSIGDPQSLNRYAYVVNRPMNFSDPTGHVPSTSYAGPASILDPNDSLALEMAAGALPEQYENEITAWAHQDEAAAHDSSTAGASNADTAVAGSAGKAGSDASGARLPTNIAVVTIGPHDYNGDPLVSPLGEVLETDANGNAVPHYGNGMTLDYVVLDQFGNPMGPETGVLLGETVKSADPNVKAFIDSGYFRNSNGERSPTDSNGAWPDRIGPVTPSKVEAQRMQSAKGSFEVSQRIVVYAPNAAGRPQGVLAMDNKIVVTNGLVSITFGEVRHFSK